MSVFLNNLDDFIAPSQACVNPLVTQKNAQKSTPSSSSSSNKVSLKLDTTTSEFDYGVAKRPNLIKTVDIGQKKVATVSLNDCLACSGCVTSAETVLIEQQNYMKLLDQLSDPNTIPIISLSSQSLSSLAHLIDMSLSDTFLKIATLFKLIGVKYVIHGSCTGDIALYETRKEFLYRYRNDQKMKWQDPSICTTALSSTCMNIIHSSSNTKEIQCGYTYDSNPTLPMFVSQCPGWICYVEKTHPQLLPYLSTTKSPQQILGSLLKKVFYSYIVSNANTTYSTNTATTSSSSSSPSLLLSSYDMNTSKLPSLLELLSSSSSSSSTTITNTTTITTIDNQESHRNHRRDKKVYIVSIQPCFDKKLEGSRLDFYHDDIGESEVDLVLSTTEFWNCIEYIYTHPHTYPQISTIITTNKSNENSHILNSSTTTESISTTLPSSSSSSSVESSIHVSPTIQDIKLFIASFSLDSCHGWNPLESLLRSYSLQGDQLVTSISMNNGSGGYMEYITRYLLEIMYTCTSSEKMLETVSESVKSETVIEIVKRNEVWDIKLPYKYGRNTDIAEVDLLSIVNDLNSSPPPPLTTPTLPSIKVGYVYGFRHIQSIIMKMKKNQLDLHCIEIMACPSGCLNGGGQLKMTNKETLQESKIRIGEIQLIHHQNMSIRKIEDNPLLQYLYPELYVHVCQSNICDSVVSQNTKEDSHYYYTQDNSQIRSINSNDTTAMNKTIDSNSSVLDRYYREWFHTRYHAIPKLETIAPLTTKW